MKKADVPFLLQNLDEMFPDAHCELSFSNPFECLVAVSLSAQTSDASVNAVTPALFEAYPDPEAMMKAKIEDLEDAIRTLGLYRNKARNLHFLCNSLIYRFGGELPKTKEELMTLPGVGAKTANVVMAECYGVPAIAVDTHVHRVSIRLGLAKEGDDPLEVERKLEKVIPVERYIKSHHQLIFLGRRICHARKPECEKCALREKCSYAGKNKSISGK